MTSKLSPSFRFVAGTTFSCVASLLLFNLLINYFLPEGIPGYKDLTNARISKLPAMIHAEGNPDVLLLGASGIVIPSVRCDDDFHQRPSRYDEKFMKTDVWMYAKSDYFANLLSRRLRNDITVSNTGSGGCVMSDQYLVLKKYLDAGKKPKYILITTGPKDFFDNIKPKIEKTPIYTELADLPIRVGDVIQGNTKIDTALPEMTDSLMRTMSSFYFFRDDYRAYLARHTANVTKHPESLEKASALIALQTGAPAATGTEPAKSKASERYLPDVEKDVRRFRHIYLPISKTQFEKQLQYLERTIDLAKSHKIPVQVVFMPFTAEHKAILIPEAWNMYKTRVAEVAARSQVACLDPQEEIGFEKTDFEDTAHLNATGGKKYFNYLTEKICSDRKIAASLGRNEVLIGQD